MPPSLLATALSYARQNLAVFPVKITLENKKIPLTPNGFKDATVNEEELKKFFANGNMNAIGMATGLISKRVVLDIDVKDGKKGFESLDIIKKEYKDKTGLEFPQTPVARSHTQGIHIHFAATKPYGTLAGIKDGVDFRGDGGFIVMPGSFSHLGTYSWDMETFNLPLAPLPDALYDILSPPKEKYEIPNVITKGSRHAHLCHFAAGLRSYDFSEEMLRVSLTQLVSRMEILPNDPPNFDEDINAVCRWAMRLAPSSVSKEIAKLKQTVDPTNLEKFERYDTLPPLLDLAENETDQKWLIDGIWTDKSRGFIAGNPGVGKTWFALSMCLSVASGHPFLECRKVSEPRPTLLIEEETSRKNVAQRIKMLVKHADYSADEFARLKDVFFLVRQGIKLPQDQNPIIEFMLKNNIKFVVFDSLRRFHSAEENSSKDMQPILEALANIAKQTDASVAVIHHLHKSGKENAPRSVFERLRGTSDFWAWRDVVVGLENDAYSSEESKVVFQFREAEATPPFLMVRENLQGKVTLRQQNVEETTKFTDMGAEIKEKLVELGPSFKNTILKEISGRRVFKFEVFEWMLRTNQIRQNGKKFEVVPLSDFVEKVPF